MRTLKLLIFVLAMGLASCGTTRTVPITGRQQSLLVDDAQMLSLSTQEYNKYMQTEISKIITGEYDLDKFDEFVDRWYKNGGEAVTERVRAWYAGKQ